MDLTDFQCLSLSIYKNKVLKNDKNKAFIEYEFFNSLIEGTADVLNGHQEQVHQPKDYGKPYYFSE